LVALPTAVEVVLEDAVLTALEAHSPGFRGCSTIVFGVAGSLTHYLAVLEIRFSS